MSPRTDGKGTHLHVQVKDEQFTLEVEDKKMLMDEEVVKSLIRIKLFCECCVKDIRIDGPFEFGECSTVIVVDFQDNDGKWGINVLKGGGSGGE